MSYIVSNCRYKRSIVVRDPKKIRKVFNGLKKKGYEWNGSESLDDSFMRKLLRDQCAKGRILLLDLYWVKGTQGEKTRKTVMYGFAYNNDDLIEQMHIRVARREPRIPKLRRIACAIEVDLKGKSDMLDALRGIK